MSVVTLDRSSNHEVADTQKESRLFTDIVLRDAWLPVADSTAISRKPIKRSVHSQPYYLWKDAKGIQIAEHHPNASKAERDRTTFFTGGTGKYPAIERYGYVWAWYGDPANADETTLPDVPYLPREGGLPWYMRGTVRYDCAAALSLENLLDLTHGDFVHASMLGDEQSESDEVEYWSTSETITMIRTCKNKSVAPVMRRVGGVRAKLQNTQTIMHIFFRSHVALGCGIYRPGFDMPTFHPCVPEARDRTRVDFTMNMALTSKRNPFRYVMPQMSYVISAQDNAVLRAQNPRYSTPIPRRDLHSKFDVAGQQYRQLVSNLADRQAAGDYSYKSDGIPSKDISQLFGVDRAAYRS
jgi:phenylpropionate dioxygenase-like ring-hydroxylating dioxygenase large terminal subunit